jgi:hypothetical protein
MMRRLSQDVVVSDDFGVVEITIAVELYSPAQFNV